MESIYLNYSLNYPNLEKALKSGAKMHCFLSGGSLRVVRVEKSGELVSYGEYPYFSGALAHAENDFGLNYEEQYGGENAKHEHYLTGAYPLPHDYFDTYLKMGKQFDILYSNQKNQFVCISEFGKGKVIWGSSSNILSSIMDCLLFRHSYTGDKDSFMETIHTDGTAIIHNYKSYIFCEACFSFSLYFLIKISIKKSDLYLFGTNGKSYA